MSRTPVLGKLLGRPQTSSYRELSQSDLKKVWIGIASKKCKVFFNLAISAAAGDKEVPRQELGLEHVGLVTRVELKHLPESDFLTPEM